MVESISDNQPKRITVVESFVEGKVPAEDRCEDAVYIGEDYVAVFDGATSDESILEESRTPGRIAAEILSRAIRTMDPLLSGREAMRYLDTAIASWYREVGILERLRGDVQLRVNASAAILSVNCREVWMIGDCQALIDEGRFTFHKRTDALMEEVRAFVLESELAAGATVESLLDEDRGREVIDYLIRCQRRFQNRGEAGPYDYYVLDGFLPPDAPVRIHPLPRGTATVILASDGYPKLFPTLAESEDVLQDLLRSDPLLFREVKSTKGAYPGNRSFDDRAYVRVVVPSE